MSKEPSNKNFSLLIDETPMPAHIPAVEEIGASSGPLLSASFFIGAKCTPFNDDFMLCKQENNYNPELNCLREGRRVTRCAQSVIKDLKTYCSDEFRLHWQCLETNNQQLWGCRPAEKLLNKCVFNSMGLTKTVPGVQQQVHLKEKPVYRPDNEHTPSLAALNKAKSEGKI